MPNDFTLDLVRRRVTTTNVIDEIRNLGPGDLAVPPEEILRQITRLAQGEIRPPTARQVRHDKVLEILNRGIEAGTLREPGLADVRIIVLNRLGALPALVRWARSLGFDGNTAAGLADAIHSAAASLPKGNRKRKRRLTAADKPLTRRQNQAVELFAKHKGKIQKIADEMGISHATVNQHLKAAARKLPEFRRLLPRQSTPKKRRLPIDSRGQALLSAKVKRS
jgi:DNA-binding CsgD family transcriptional regulator